MQNFSREKAKTKPDDYKSPAIYTTMCGYTAEMLMYVMAHVGELFLVLLLLFAFGVALTSSAMNIKTRLI